MVQTNPDGPPHKRQSQILVPMDNPGVEIVGPMHVFGKDDALTDTCIFVSMNAVSPRTTSYLEKVEDSKFHKYV